MQTFDPLTPYTATRGASPRSFGTGATAAPLQAPSAGGGPGGGGGRTIPPPGGGGGGPPGGFISRFGGVQGFMSWLQQVQQGGSLMAPTSLVGQVPTQFDQATWGTLLQALGQAGGGDQGEALRDTPAATGSCMLREPAVAPSGEVRERIAEFERRRAHETYPLESRDFEQAAWNEFWTLRFATTEGVRLARLLLWLLRGLKKGRGLKPDATIRLAGRSVDLLDEDFQPESFDELNDRRPVHGEALYGFYAQETPIVVGSPFTSEETLAAVRRLSPLLARKAANCQTADDVDGDDYQALKHLALWLRLRGRPLVKLDNGAVADVVVMDTKARGGGPADVDKLAHFGPPLERADWLTTEDIRRGRERRASSTVFQKVLGTAEAADSRREDGSGAAEIRAQPWRPGSANLATQPRNGWSPPPEEVARGDDSTKAHEAVGERIPDDFRPYIPVPREVLAQDWERSAQGILVSAGPGRAAEAYREERRRQLWVEELQRRLVAEHARRWTEVPAAVTSISMGLRIWSERGGATTRSPEGVRVERSSDRRPAAVSRDAHDPADDPMYVPLNANAKVQGGCSCDDR